MSRVAIHVILRLILVASLFLFLFGIHIYFLNQALHELHVSYMSNTVYKAVDSGDYDVVEFFTSDEEDVALEQYLTIYNNPQMILKRVIRVFLVSEATVDVYLINTTGVGFIWSLKTLIENHTIYSWHNKENLNEEFNETLAYFPGLVIFNPSNRSLKYNLTVSQEMIISYPNYDIAFKGFWMAVISFFILIIMSLHFKISSYILAKRLLHIFPSRYGQFLKADYELDKQNYFPIEFLTAGLYGFMCLLKTINEEYAFHRKMISNFPLISNYPLIIVKNTFYYAFILLLIFGFCFILILFFFCGLIGGLLLRKRYLAFKNFDDYIMYSRKIEEIGKGIIRNVGITTWLYALLLLPITNYLGQYYNPMLVDIALLSLLMVIIGFIIAQRYKTLFAYIDSLKAGLLLKFSFCVMGGVGGLGFFISYLLVYYLISLEHFNKQLFVLNIMFNTFSELTNIILLMPYLFSILVLILYLTFSILIIRYIQVEDRERFKKEQVEIPLVITTISFLMSILYHILDRASRMPGDPLKRIVNAMPEIFNINTFLTAILIEYALLVITDYYTLSHSMSQLRNR